MKIRIIADSGCDMPRPWPEDLTVLPLTVSFGTESYADGIELDHRAFYEKLIEGDVLPTTSQVSPGQFEQAFTAAVDAGETVVAVTPSNLLFLDEPTNHLDIATKDSLRKAIVEFNGGVIIVSHERDFFRGNWVDKTIDIEKMNNE